MFGNVAMATLVFPNLRTLRWLEDTRKQNIDPDGSVDFGVFHYLEQEEGGSFLLSGDFGRIAIESDPPLMTYARDFE
jgi:hypothetical protein